METSYHRRILKLDEDEEETATRHCWECVRRRVVCDRALPTCKKCLIADKNCPGYDEQRPLQWIENGKVTSRKAKKEITPKLLAPNSTSRSPSNRHDQEIQQLSYSVLTVVEGQLAHQVPTSRNIGTSYIPQHQVSAAPASTYPQYYSNNTAPSSMYPPHTPPTWHSNSGYGNGQYSNVTTAGQYATTSTYPQMISSSGNGYQGYDQVQQQYQTVPRTSAPDNDPAEVHAQFLFL